MRKERAKVEESTKEGEKEKGMYQRPWYQAPRVPPDILMDKLLKKGDRHQAEWQELPRKKLLWESLKADQGNVFCA